MQFKVTTFRIKRPAGAINQIRTSKHFCIFKFASGLLGNDVIWIATLPILIEGVDTISRVTSLSYFPVLQWTGTFISLDDRASSPSMLASDRHLHDALTALSPIHSFNAHHSSFNIGFYRGSNLHQSLPSTSPQT